MLRLPQVSSFAVCCRSGVLATCRLQLVGSAPIQTVLAFEMQLSTNCGDVLTQDEVGAELEFKMVS